MKRSVVSFVATSTKIVATSALLVGLVGTTLPASTAQATTAPSHLGLATGGQYTTGLRLQWDWSKADTHYQLRVAPDEAFDGPTTTSVTRSSTAPAGKLQATTVENLQTATWYYARVRSVQGTDASGWSAPIKVATAVAWPDPITAVTSTPGPRAGEVTVRWASTGTYVSQYRIDTALSIFSRTDPTLPSVSQRPLLHGGGRPDLPHPEPGAARRCRRPDGIGQPPLPPRVRHHRGQRRPPRAHVRLTSQQRGAAGDGERAAADPGGELQRPDGRGR